MKKFITTSIVMVLLVFPISLLAWVKQVGMNDIDDIKLTGLSAADSARMKLDVEKLSIDYAKRNVENVPTLNLAEQYVESELKKVTNRVEIQSYQVDNEKFNNVIAHFGPTAGKPIIIGAHYDAHENTMGADDNASGVAGLLELARIFSKQPPNVPVQIVAYTLEEPPNFRTDNMGSRHHALSLVQADIKPKLVLVLEMIGFYNDEENSQAYPVGILEWFYPTHGNFIAVVGKFTEASTTELVKKVMQTSHPEFPVESISAPASMKGIDFSDHASYWLHDIPAVMITDTSFYRNPHYHKPTDTADTIDYVRMAKVVDSVYAIVVYKDSKSATGD